jgi:hypothetical protein
VRLAPHEEALLHQPAQPPRSHPHLPFANSPSPRSPFATEPQFS